MEKIQGYLIGQPILLGFECCGGYNQVGSTCERMFIPIIAMYYWWFIQLCVDLRAEMEGLV